MQNQHHSPVDRKIFAHETATIADPGAGNPADFACPVNARIRITNVVARFGVTQANKFPQILIVTAAAHSLTFASSDTDLDAPVATAVHFSTGPKATNYINAENTIFIPLPGNIILEPGETLRITMTGINVGQQIALITISYDQWIIA